MKGVSALDNSPNNLITNGSGQSWGRRRPKALSSLHTGTPGSWSPSQRWCQWHQVLDRPLLVHQALWRGNSPILLWNAQCHSFSSSLHFLEASSTISALTSESFVFCIFVLLCSPLTLAPHKPGLFSLQCLSILAHNLVQVPPLLSRHRLFCISQASFVLSVSNHKSGWFTWDQCNIKSPNNS